MLIIISCLGSALKCYTCAPDDKICKENLRVQECPEVPHETKSRGGSMICINAAVKEDDKLSIFRGCAPQGELKSLEVVLFFIFFNFFNSQRFRGVQNSCRSNRKTKKLSFLRHRLVQWFIEIELQCCGNARPIRHCHLQ
jgi:hypothetical protein